MGKGSSNQGDRLTTEVATDRESRVRLGGHVAPDVDRIRYSDFPIQIKPSLDCLCFPAGTIMNGFDLPDFEA
jgi:hypothetical protein